MAGLGQILGTAAGGGLGFLAGGPAGAMIGAGIGGSLFPGSKPNTINNGVLETPEQAAARKKLLALGSGNTTYGGPLGDFNMTGTEQAGQGKLAGIVSGGNPAIFNTGVKSLNDLLTGDSFNPNDPNGIYAAFKPQVEQNIAQGDAAVKQAAAFGHNLYSTDTIQNLGRVQQQGNLDLQSKLADMYQTYVGQKLGAIPQALAAGGQQQGMDLNAVNAAETLGSVPRQLSTAGDVAAQNNFYQGQGVGVGALESVSGGAPQFGPSSYTLPASGGPFGQVLNTLAYGGGMLLGKGTTASTMGSTPMPASTSSVPPYLMSNQQYDAMGYPSYGSSYGMGY